MQARGAWHTLVPLDHGVDQVGGGRRHAGDVEAALAAEVVVEQALGDPGFFCDPLNGDLLIGVAGKELDAELQELRAALVEVQSPFHGSTYTRLSNKVQ